MKNEEQVKDELINIIQVAINDMKKVLVEYNGEWRKEDDNLSFHLQGYHEVSRVKALSGKDDVFGVKLIAEVFPF